MNKKKKVEFHVHTVFSSDSMLNLFFLTIMCKIKKIDCLVITDHNEISGAIYFKNKLKRYGIDVIVGEEIFTSDGEIIGLFLEQKICPGLSALDTVLEIKKQNGIVYIPHPFDEKRKNSVININALTLIKDYVDFIEVHNGRNIKKYYSNKQEEIANKFSFNKIVGSDSHTFFELGRNFCLIDSYEKTKIIQSVNNGFFHTSDCLSFAHIVTKIVKLEKMILKGDIYGIIRIINKKVKGRK